MSMADVSWITAFSPAWFALALGGLIAGYGAGLLHFRSLQAVVRRFVKGDWTAALLQVGRFALLGILLFLFAGLGAQVLLAGAAGILLARRRVLAQAEAGT